MSVVHKFKVTTNATHHRMTRFFVLRASNAIVILAAMGVLGITNKILA